MNIGRFDEPLKGYSKELKRIKTFEDFKALEEKYSLILDDAAPAFEVMTESSFPEFIEQLPKAYREGPAPDDDWMKKYAAVVLPKLFIQLADILSRTQMPSGFILHRLLDAGLAKIENGRFRLLEQNGQG